MSDGYVRIDTKLDESGLKTGLAKLGGLVAAGIGASVTALASFGKEIIKVGTEYEAQMSRVQAISGATAAELVELDNLAKQLGADTAFSAAEAAEGMENLASAGFSVTEIMGAMPGLLDLAAVSGGDVANASEVAASALRAFGLEATEAGHVADVFAQAAADTNAEVNDMGYAMKYIAPVANAMGISLEETAAAIGILSDAGIKGTQAGTTLRGALTRLTKPTDDMCAVMDDLGLSFYDSEGKMISLADQVAMLQKSFVGLTDEEKQNALTVLYGTSSLSGMLALIDAGPEKLSTLTKSFEDCDGAAAEMAETMLNNLSGAVENLSGSAETLGLSIYDSLKEPLKEAVVMVDGYVAQMQEAFNDGGFEGLVSSVGDVLSQVVDEIVNIAPVIIDAGASLLQSLVDGLISNAPSLASAAIDLGNTLVGAFSSLTASLLQLGVELVAAMCSGFRDNSSSLALTVTEAISSIIEVVVSSIPTLIEAAGNVVLGVAEALPTILAVLPETVVTVLVESIPLLLEAVSSIVSSIAEALPGLVVTIVETLPALVGTIVDSLTVLLPQIIDCVVALVDSLVAQLPTIINTIVLALPSIVNSIDAALLDLAPLIVDCGVQLLVSLVQALPDIIYAIVNVLPTIVAAIISTLVGLIPLIIECGIELLVSLVSALPEIITAIVAVLPQIINSIISALLDNIPLIIQCGIDLLVSLIAALPDIIVALVGAVPTIITSIINALLSNKSLIAQSGIQLLTSLITSLPQIISTLVKAVPQIITALINAFKSGVSKFTTMGKELLNGLGQGISNAVTGIVEKSIKACKKITDSVKKFFGINSPSKLFEDIIGKNLMLGMAVGIDEESSTVEDSLADMADRVAESKFPVPEVDFDYDGVVDNFRAAVGSTRKAISDTLSSAEVSVKSGDSDDVTSAKNNSPEYIENNIYVDGKKTARIITPYVAKELDWEDK